MAPQAGFGHDYGCVRLGAVPADHLLRVLPRCFTEVMRRIANPLRAWAPRAFKNGPRGEGVQGRGCLTSLPRLSCQV